MGGWFGCVDTEEEGKEEEKEEEEEEKEEEERRRRRKATHFIPSISRWTTSYQ